MKPKKPETVEPKAEISYGPFSEPRTIPGGWDVSAFYSSAQAGQPCPADTTGTESVNENTEDTLP